MLKTRNGRQNMSLTEWEQVSNFKLSWGRFKLFSFKFALLFHDLVIVVSLAVVSCNLEIGADNLKFNLLFTLAILFFLNALALYSYHRIYSMRLHLIAIGKVWLYVLLTLFLMMAIIGLPDIWNNSHAVPLIITAGVMIMGINRLFEIDLSGLLYAGGIALILVGAFEFWCSPNLTTGAFSWSPAMHMLIASTAALTFSRIATVHWVFGKMLRRKFRRQVLVVGSNAEALEFAHHIYDLNAPFWIAGTVDYKGDFDCHLISVHSKECLGDLHQLPALAREYKISEIVVTAEDIPKRDLIGILDFCTSAGINAWFLPNLMPIIDIKLYIDQFCGKPMIRFCSQKHFGFFYKVKNVCDALIALPLFLVQLPLFLFLTACIKLDSKGPVFYRANAIGKGGKPFEMYKFRSMVADAKKTIHKQFVSRLIKGELATDGNNGGPLKIVDDPRVTRVGRILRKTSLDELPQLLNVLVGQMSLVGPRPCLTYEYEIYKDWHKKRTLVRPGITGLWQVTGRSEVLFEDMILLDLYYIYNNSLILDFQILIRTIFVVFGKKGAY